MANRLSNSVPSSDNCSICLEPLNDRHPIKTLHTTERNVAHIFHRHCIDPWMRSQDTCPLCREVVGIQTPAGLRRARRNRRLAIEQLAIEHQIAVREFQDQNERLISYALVVVLVSCVALRFLQFAGFLE